MRLSAWHSFSALLFLSPFCGAVAASEQEEWRSYARDARSTKYSSLDQITTKNARRLRIAWQWNSPDNEERARQKNLSFNLFECTPLMADGVLYVVTNLQRVVAITADKGQTRWTYDLGVYDPAAADFGQPGGLGFIHRGLALWSQGSERRLLVGSAKGELIALDATSGQPLSSFGKAGRIDLRNGVHAENAGKFYGVSSPPLIVGDTVIVGSAIGDSWIKNEAPRGDVRAYDVRSGELRWTFHVVAQPGDPGNTTWRNESWRYTGAANVWTWMSADPELGYVYLPTSTPTNDYYGGHRLGDNLYGESIVCLDARNGKRVWHFQTTHHGLWDYDLPCAPILADIRVSGTAVPALVQLSKQAFAYVLDRRTGKPIWPIEERSVPASKMPGEMAAPTQPFPTRPKAFDRQGVVESDLIDFTPALRAEAKTLVERYGYDPLYTPASEEAVIVVPGSVGGASWAGGALDPESQTLFVPSVTDPQLVHLWHSDSKDSDQNFRLKSRPSLTLPNGLPLFKPPFGRITAIDLNTGETKWVVPHGTGPVDHPELKALGLKNLGWPSRGFVVATKSLLFAVQDPAITKRPPPPGGGTLFYDAQTREPKLRCLDKSTGAVVAELDLPANAGGSPLTYLYKGQQFVVIPVGGGGVPAQLVAVTLDGKTNGGESAQ